MGASKASHYNWNIVVKTKKPIELPFSSLLEYLPIIAGGASVCGGDKK
jgi:hypothetical protein